jgi:ribosomal protein S16
MSVTIRLSRQGAKKNPNYLIVATSERGKRDGAYLQNLGQYFPKAKAAKDKLKVKDNLKKRRKRKKLKKVKKNYQFSLKENI